MTNAWTGDVDRLEATCQACYRIATSIEWPTLPMIRLDELAEVNAWSPEYDPGHYHPLAWFREKEEPPQPDVVWPRYLGMFPNG